MVGRVQGEGEVMCGEECWDGGGEVGEVGCGVIAELVVVVDDLLCSEVPP